MRRDEEVSVNPEVVVCTPERLKTLVASAVKDVLGASAQLLVDKQTLAQRLSCSAAHIDNLRKQGLPIVRVGEAIRFDPQAVLDWLRNREQHA